MEIKEIRFEEDEKGKHKIIEYANGISVKLLREPSEAYKEKQRQNAEKAKIKNDAMQVEKDKNKMITDKMRELAITELEKEGKL